jgi:hypothetical protein
MAKEILVRSCNRLIARHTSQYLHTERIAIHEEATRSTDHHGGHLRHEWKLVDKVDVQDESDLPLRETPLWREDSRSEPG